MSEITSHVCTAVMLYRVCFVPMRLRHNVVRGDDVKMSRWGLNVE